MACLVPSGKHTILATQMYVHDAPCACASPPKSLDLLQGSDRVDYDDSPAGGTAGDLPHRFDNPVGSLKSCIEPTSLQQATVKVSASFP